MEGIHKGDEVLVRTESDADIYGASYLSGFRTRDEVERKNFDMHHCLGFALRLNKYANVVVIASKDAETILKKNALLDDFKLISRGVFTSHAVAKQTIKSFAERHEITDALLEAQEHLYEII